MDRPVWFWHEGAIVSLREAMDTLLRNARRETMPTGTIKKLTDRGFGFVTMSSGGNEAIPRLFSDSRSFASILKTWQKMELCIQ